MKKKNVLAIVILSMFICGCAAWQLVGASQKWSYGNFEAMLPEGWMKSSYSGDLLYLTKDGGLLQNIRVFRYQIGKEKELALSKKEFTAEMLPQEMSELIIDEMSLDKSRLRFKVSENIPYTLSGKEAFRLEYTFSSPDNLKEKAIMYGFKDEKYVYIIQYQAAQQYYFDKNVADFNRFIGSFIIKNK